MQVPQQNPDMKKYYNYTSPAMPDGVWIIYGVIENFFAAIAVVVDVDFVVVAVVDAVVGAMFWDLIEWN